MRLKNVWIGTVCMAACFMGCAVALLGYQSKAAANKVFGNMAYLTSYPDWFESVTLVNGRYSWREKSSDGFFLFYHLDYKSHYVYGDFNRDELKDAAVIISEGEGGSGDFRALAFLINDGERLVHRSSQDLGDRVRINSLKERGGHVIVDLFVHRENDCRAGPTKRVKQVYKYEAHEV